MSSHDQLIPIRQNIIMKESVKMLHVRIIILDRTSPNFSTSHRFRLNKFDF